MEWLWDRELFSLLNWRNLLDTPLYWLEVGWVFIIGDIGMKFKRLVALELVDWNGVWGNKMGLDTERWPLNDWIWGRTFPDRTSPLQERENYMSAA
jgi:hypothetical protein